MSYIWYMSQMLFSLIAVYSIKNEEINILIFRLPYILVSGNRVDLVSKMKKNVPIENDIDIMYILWENYVLMMYIIWNWFTCTQTENLAEILIHYDLVWRELMADMYQESYIPVLSFLGISVNSNSKRIQKY